MCKEDEDGDGRDFDDLEVLTRGNEIQIYYLGERAVLSPKEARCVAARLLSVARDVEQATCPQTENTKLAEVKTENADA